MTWRLFNSTPGRKSNRRRLSPAQGGFVRASAVALVLVLAGHLMASPSPARADESGFTSAEVTATQFFEPLQHNVVDLTGQFADDATYRAAFLGNFDRTGGIERWGYPTSAIFEETPGTLTQYYQRGVVDWQPPPGGGGHVFQRRLAWDYLGGGVGGSIDQGVEPHLTNPNPGDLVGPWGHRITNQSVEGANIGFANFFHRLGGVSSFGYPKTDARRDTHPQAVLRTPGRPPDSRIRQYFQAAVIEYHPETPASPVKLSLLGDTLRNHRYPHGAWQQYLAFGPEASLAVGDHLKLGLASRGPHGSTVEDVAKFLELSLLRVSTDRACGSGFFVSESGYAVTTWNLVMDATTIAVENPRGYTANAHLVAGDAERDIALIKVDGEGHIPVLWADMAIQPPHAELVAVGYHAPHAIEGRGVECQAIPTATTLFVPNKATTRGLSFLPTTSPGNSGGPAGLMSGHVAGITGSGSPEDSRADFLIPTAEARPLIDSWLRDIGRGSPPALPGRPRFDRVIMVDRDLVPCPGSPGQLEVQASSLEVTADVALHPNRIPISIIRFRAADDTAWRSHDQINFGPHSSNDEFARFSWRRLHMGRNISLKSEDPEEIARNGRFHLRFVYNNGSVALFINGKAVHQESGLPYGEYIYLSLECFGWAGTGSIHYIDVRIIGKPLL